MINKDAAVEPGSSSHRVQTIAQSAIIFSLLIYAIFAPHSIAITQAAYVIGMVAWGVEIIATRNYRKPRTPIDIAVFGFFTCSVISSFLSYELLTSVKGLRSPAFFLAFYFVFNNVKSLRMARVLALLLVSSCMVNVLYSAGQIAVGRGLRIDAISEGGAFDGEGFELGDVILKADDEKVKTLEDLSRIADESRGRMMIVLQRNESIIEGSISRKAVRKSGEEGIARLGISTSPGRSFRVSGFYSHYETYAEVLQLIAALAIGMFIALPEKRSFRGVFLAGATLLITVALIQTSTRAPLIGLAIGAVTIALASSRRRVLVLAVVAMVILAPLAYKTIKSARGDILFNLQEESTTYRFEVWGEAMGLIKDHPLAGIGKGSEGGSLLREKYALYNNGQLPPGHFHSSYIQIATWWGLPALAFYTSMMMIFFLEMRKLSRRLIEKEAWTEWGIVLGGIGGLVAFNISSIGHFNFGDGEVVMLFWMITGLVFAVRRLTSTETSFHPTVHSPTLPVGEDSRKNQPLRQEETSEYGVRAAAATQNSPSQQ